MRLFRLCERGEAKVQDIDSSVDSTFTLNLGTDDSVNGNPGRKNFFDDSALDSTQNSVKIHQDNILSSKTKRARKQTNKQFVHEGQKD